MTPLSEMARAGTDIVGRSAREAARRTAIAAFLWGAALVILAIAMGFGAMGLFLLLEAWHGPVTAAFGVATAGLVLAALLAFFAARPLRDAPSRQTPSQPRSQPEAEPRGPSPETTAAMIGAGFLTGIFTGRP